MSSFFWLCIVTLRPEFDIEGRKVVKAISTSKPMPPPTNVPAAVKVPFPEHLRLRLGGHSGYSAAHDMYNECHQFYHDRAMSAGNIELVTLSATMAYPQSGKFKVVGVRLLSLFSLCKRAYRTQ